jgi:hypothetical protein
VRMMPKKVVQPGSPSQQVTWDSMKDSNISWSYLDDEAHKAWSLLSGQSQMSGRDLCISIALTCNSANPNSFEAYWVEWDEIGEDVTTAWLWIQPNDYNYWGAFSRACWLNEEERQNLLYWVETYPTLRGKKIRRKWRLIQRARYCHRKLRRNIYTKEGPGDRHVSCTKSNGDKYLFIEHTGSYQPPGGHSGLFRIPYLE